MTRRRSLPVLGLACATLFVGCKADQSRQFTFGAEVVMTLERAAGAEANTVEFEALERAWSKLTLEMSRDEVTEAFFERKLTEEGATLTVFCSEDVGEIEAPAQADRAVLHFADVALSMDPIGFTEVVRAADGSSATCRRMIAIGWVGEPVRDEYRSVDPLIALFVAAAADHLARHLPGWTVAAQ